MTIALWLFTALLVAHVIYSVVSNRLFTGSQPTGRLRTVHVLMQGPLFWVATFIGFQDGAFSRELVSPLYIGMGLIAGHIIFGLSVWATHHSWRDAWSHFFDFGPIWNFAMDSPIVLTRFIGVALAEELIWRVVAQKRLIELLSPHLSAFAPAVGIALTAAAFAIVHKHFFENTWFVSLEFCAFAVLLGVLYYWTNSFILVLVIHALRDIEIAYLEYLMKVEELGDKAQAAHAIEQTYRPGRTEGT
ncbi:MAG: hypothetical protein AMXMBFR4_15280 [Candidatus Hydrogenedentota bacterium]